MIAVLLLLAAFPQQARADDSLRLAEQEIKAGLLYNFLKYTQWPKADKEPASMQVCIFGKDPFEGYLQPMAGRTVNQREITIRNVDAVAETGGCHLLFINADEKDRWPELRDLLAGKSVLTVSDFKGFAASGGMIEFGMKENRISVELNIEVVAKAGLHVQERLLKLVTVVHPASQEEKR